MEPRTRYALVIGVGTFDDPQLAPLPQAEADADRMHCFLSDPSRGSVAQSNITVLKSPTLNDVKEALDDILFRAGNADRGLAILYFATHAGILGRQGVQLMTRDSDLNRRTKTSLSTKEIADFIGEYRPASTILILDVCEAGGHAAGAAELALNELWQDPILKNSTMADGHFILGACATNESACEDVLTGGLFTSLLLKQIDEVGSSRPYEKNLTVEAVAGAIVKAAAESGWSQHPTWSGLSVSKEVFLSANPYWSNSATPPPDAVSLSEMGEADRQALLSQARKQWSADNLIGSGSPWAHQSIEALQEVAASSVSNEAKRLFIARATHSVFDRVAAYGEEKDLGQLLELVEAAVVFTARADGVYEKELKGIAFSTAKLAQKELTSLETWEKEQGWLPDRDGPASIGLAPIRFWDTLGRASLVALACRVAADFRSEGKLAALVAEIVRAHPHLYRVTWVGQYPDLTVTLGYVMRKDVTLARECIRNILDRFVADAQKGLRPVEVGVKPRELGLTLAKHFVGAGAPVSAEIPQAIAADEIPALCLLFLHVAGESDLSLNTRVGKLAEVGELGDYYLYEPTGVTSQFIKHMTDCRVHTWVRSSLESAASMLSALPHLCAAPFDLRSPELPIELFASAAAGRYFRNRTTFGLAKGIQHSH
jgi:hypothetical protein